MELDDWQREVLETKGNLCLCSGRQVGKSTVISIKAGESAIQSKKCIMVIAATERQALLLFEKILGYIHENYKKHIFKTPTKHKLKLKNGSEIHCLPTGESGYGIRGFTIDELYADEAAFIPEAVWAAVTPMLATTGGQINLLSTPFGSINYFARCYNDPKFKSFHVSTPEVAELRTEPQRTYLKEFIKDEKGRMTKLQYQQEYLGLFVGGIMRMFPDELIKSCMFPEGGTISNYHSKSLFLGVDIARMGGDETVLCSVNRISRDELEMIDLDIPEGQALTATARHILHKDRKYNYKKIYLDTGGMGIAVYDILFEEPRTKRKVVSIDNAKKTIDREKGQENYRKLPLIKEDMYNNLKNLMENKKIRIFDDFNVFQSLRSIQYEYSDGGRLIIHGTYSHIAESLIRACWCTKDKGLNIYIS